MYISHILSMWPLGMLPNHRYLTTIPKPWRPSSLWGGIKLKINPWQSRGHHVQFLNWEIKTTGKGSSTWRRLEVQRVTPFRLSFIFRAALSELRHCFLHDSCKFTLETRLKRHMRFNDKLCLDSDPQVNRINCQLGAEKGEEDTNGTHPMLLTRGSLHSPHCSAFTADGARLLALQVCSGTGTKTWKWNDVSRSGSIFTIDVWVQMNKNVARLQEPWW